MKLPRFLVFGFLALLIFVEGASLPHGSSSRSSTEDEDSMGFMKAAAILKGSMNESIDPCEDFFEFTCGKWMVNNPIPDDLATYTHFEELREKVKKEMRNLYEDKVPSTSNAINKLKKIYATCTDVENFNKRKSHDLHKTLETFGYWPIIHDKKWSAVNFDLTDLLLKIEQSRGSEIFIDINIVKDRKNVSRRLLSFDQGNLGLGTREYYLNETKYSKQLDAYEKYVTTKVGLIAEDAKISKTKNDITLDVKEILEFEKKLARILKPGEERRNFTEMYNLFRFSDLKTMMPLIDWEKYFKGLIPLDMHDYLDLDPEIIVAEPAYLDRVKNLIAGTDTRIITNYILWRYTAYWDLDERFDDIRHELLHILTGKKIKSPRWKDCSSIINSKMSYASGAMYVRSFFHEEDKASALEMIENLKTSFKETLAENDWMEESTRKYAQEKASEMSSLIGFPDFVLNDTALDEYYENLTIVEGEPYSTVTQKMIQWAQYKAFRRLKEEVDRNEFEKSSAEVNAFYSSVKNGITFPAAILQPPFFDRTFPKVLNYGAIGMVIGHEITHAFDDQGSQFDKMGNLHNWWDAETKTTFLERTRCMIDQYSQYEVPGTSLKVNGILTQGENVADNGGLKHAYMAYRAYIKKLGHEEGKIPGFEKYTTDQIFYIGYGITWCGHSKPRNLINQILTGVHSPSRFRVNGVVRNQPEFAVAFKCSVGSKMNPEKRCAVW
ncbi:hypothetical protein FO519_000824 [Halicephalobus sp. NKZ332]|nr:hypothetical protein FO519_000824 [Halicephalobus sp. NKZ332]